MRVLAIITTYCTRTASPFLYSDRLTHARRPRPPVEKAAEIAAEFPFEHRCLISVHRIPLNPRPLSVHRTAGVRSVSIRYYPTAHIPNADYEEDSDLVFSNKSRSPNVRQW